MIFFLFLIIQTEQCLQLWFYGGIWGESGEKSWREGEEIVWKLPKGGWEEMFTLRSGVLLLSVRFQRLNNFSIFSSHLYIQLVNVKSKIGSIIKKSAMSMSNKCQWSPKRIACATNRILIDECFISESLGINATHMSYLNDHATFIMIEICLCCVSNLRK